VYLIVTPDTEIRETSNLGSIPQTDPPDIFRLYEVADIKEHLAAFVASKPNLQWP
jgi:hypothetical protein